MKHDERRQAAGEKTGPDGMILGAALFLAALGFFGRTAWAATGLAGFISSCTITADKSM